MFHGQSNRAADLGAYDCIVSNAAGVRYGCANLEVTSVTRSLDSQRKLAGEILLIIEDSSSPI